jgi:hypothetical protein
MERSFGEERCWLAVISTGRPRNVERIQEQVGEATWYVQEGDAETYDVRSLVVCDAGVSVARNQALEDAFARGLTCVQLSDDLRGFRVVNDFGEVREVTAEEALGLLLDYLAMFPYHLAGFPPTDNTLFSTKSKTITTTTFIVGDCIAVKPTPLRFDEELKLKEDYGYTAAHIEEYGGALRLNWIVASFDHRSNPGGAVNIRTPELERGAVGRLMEQYAGWFRLNESKEGTEILLRVPKRFQRVRLE